MLLSYAEWLIGLIGLRHIEIIVQHDGPNPLSIRLIKTGQNSIGAKMAPRKNTSGASYVKMKLQESDQMGKVEASAAALLSECSAVLIRKLVASTPHPMTMANLKSTIEKDDTFQCLRSALDDFQPVQLSASFLSAHLKRQGRVVAANKNNNNNKKRPAPANKRKNPPTASTRQKTAPAAASHQKIIAVKAMEDVDQEFATRIEETSTDRGQQKVIEDEEDYD
jgi:hypothetical protein